MRQRRRILIFSPLLVLAFCLGFIVVAVLTALFSAAP